MAHIEVLSTDTVLGLFNLKSGYLIVYSWLLGMCTYFMQSDWLLSIDICSSTFPPPLAIWNSFIGGAIIPIVLQIDHITDGSYL